jgi:hypothetical protein
VLDGSLKTGMTRDQQHKHNRSVINRIRSMCGDKLHSPSYKEVSNKLNDDGLTTSRGNVWTRKAVFRMLQRQGYSGLWGLFQEEKGYFCTS